MRRRFLATLSSISSLALAVGLLAGGAAQAADDTPISGAAEPGSSGLCWPTDVRAIAGNRSATVTFSVPETNTGGCPPFQYVLVNRVGQAGGFRVEVTPGGNGSYEFTGLTNGLPVAFTAQIFFDYGGYSRPVTTNYVTPSTVPAGRQPYLAFAEGSAEGDDGFPGISGITVMARDAAASLVGGANRTAAPVTVAGETFAPQESFVGAMNSVGGWQWIQRFPAITVGENVRLTYEVSSLSRHPGGGVVVGLRTDQAVPPPIAGIEAPEGAVGAAIARFDNAGAVEWVQWTRGAAYCFERQDGVRFPRCGAYEVDVAVTSMGGIVTQIFGYGTLLLGTEQVITQVGPGASSSAPRLGAAIVARMSSTGQFTQARKLGRVGGQDVLPVADVGSVQSPGIVGAVNTASDVTLDDRSIPPIASMRAVLYRVSALNGSTSFLTQFLASGTAAEVKVTSLSRLRGNQILATGLVNGTAVFVGETAVPIGDRCGFDPASPDRPGAVGPCPFVAALNLDGSLAWIEIALRSPDTRSDYAMVFTDASANSRGDIAITAKIRQIGGYPLPSSEWDFAGLTIDAGSATTQVLMLDRQGAGLWQAYLSGPQLSADAVSNLNSGLVMVGGLMAAGDLTYEGRSFTSSASGPLVFGLRDQTTEPGPVLNLTAEPGEESIAVFFEPPLDDGGREITEYVAIARGNNGQDGSCTVTPDPLADTEQLSCVITGLTNDVEYLVFVVAVNSQGDGPESTTLQVTPRNYYPGAPTEVLPIADDQRRITVSWFPPQDTGTSPIASYTATATPDDGSAVLECTSTTNKCGFDNLTNGVTYTILVTATNSEGYTGPASAPRSATPVGIPGPVRLLSVAAGNGLAVVRWSPPLDDGGEPILDYLVIASSGQECVVAPPAGAETVQCTIEGLTNGVPVTFQVSARNDLDYGPSTTSASVTPRAFPGQPTAVIVDSVGDGQVTLSWTAPADNGVAVTSYTATAIPGGRTCQVQAPATTCTITGLTNGERYAATVFATGGDGPGPTSFASSAFTPYTIPGAPAGVALEAQDRELLVQWEAPASDGGSAITGYIARTTTGASCSVEAPASSCVIGGLTNGVSYSVTVRAANTAGAGPQSTSVSGSPALPPDAPSAPQNVTLSRGNGASIIANWTAPADDGGAPVTSYTGVLSPGDRECVVAETTCTFSNLQVGTVYTFTVSAQNRAGVGEFARAASGIVAATVPNAVVVRSAPQVGNGQVTLSWDAPVGDTGLPVIDYTVTANPGGRSCSAEEPTRTCTVSGLTNGEDYTFTITARNAAGVGAASAPVGPVQPFGDVPSAPQYLRVSLDDVNAAFSWKRPATLGETVTEYRVTVTPGNRECVVDDPGAPDPFGNYSCTILGFTYGTDYTASVTATNINGVSAASVPVSFTPATAPGAPTQRSATAGNGAITVSMALPLDDGGARIRGLFATIAGSPQQSCAIPVAPGSLAAGQVTTCTIRGLTNGRAYDVEFIASNDSGFSAPVTISGVTPSSQVPSVPQDVMASAAFVEPRMTVSWQAPIDDGGAPITGYTVTTFPDGGTCTTDGARTCSIDGLQPDTVYFVLVRAVNVNGESAGGVSNRVRTNTPPQSTVPSQPRDVTAQAEDGSAVVRFGAPTTNGGADITGYIVTSTPEGLQCQTGPGVYTCRVTELTNGTPYTFTVVAENSIGESAPSAPSNAVTPRRENPEPPPPPVQPAAAPGKPVAEPGNGLAEVSWAASDQAEGNGVTGYRIERSTDGGQNWTIVTPNTGTTLTRVALTNLVNGTEYVVRVAAVSAVGVGDYSPVSDPFTPTADLPTAPTRPVGQATSQTVDLVWGAPGDFGSGEFIGYRIEQSVDGQQWVVVRENTGSNETGATIGNLANGTTYYYRVATLTSVGQSPYSQTSGGLTPTAPVPPGPPPPPPPPPPVAPPPPPPVPVPEQEILPSVPNPGQVPSGLTAPTVTVNGTSVTVTWEPPEDSGSAPITGYFVTADPGGQACQVTVEETSCTVEDLAPGTTYTFTVEAVNDAGFSEPSAASAEVTIESGTITIEGKRTKVRGKKGFVVTGTVTGLAPGTILKPFYKFRGMTGYEMGLANIRVQEDGTIRWQRRGNKRVFVYVALPDRSVRSERITIEPAKKGR